MLSIDDAFAGGVCRCQYCGTIQTVPKPSAKAAQAAADASSPKALFKRKARIESALSPYNDNLDRAADEMDSSGPLSPNVLSGLRRSAAAASGESATGLSAGGSSQTGIPSPRRATPVSAGAGNAAGTAAAATAVAPEPPRAAAGKPYYVPKPSAATVTAANAAPTSSKKPLIIACAAVGVLVCGGGLWLALGSGSKPAPAPSPLPQTPTQVAPTPVAKAEPAPAPVPVAVPQPEAVVAPTPAPVAEPVVTVIVEPGAPGTIAGISLAGPNVVYVLDRRSCTQQAFGQMLDACYTSIQSLGPGRRFAVMIWNGQQELAYPQQDLAVASAASVEECRKAIVDPSAGSSDVGPILARAVAAKVEDIVLVSAADIDDPTAMAIRDQLAKATSPVRFHGIAVGMDLTAERLKPLVADHNGQFKQVGTAELK